MKIRDREVSGESLGQRKLRKHDLAAVMKRLDELEAIIQEKGGPGRIISNDYMRSAGNAMYDLTEALVNERLDTEVESDEDSDYSKELFGTV